MFTKLLKRSLLVAIERECNLEDLLEIRFRVSRPVVIQTLRRKSAVSYSDGIFYRASKEDIDFAISVASEHSVYAVNDDLIKGFLHFKGGIRIGACGEGVVEKGDVLTLKHINFLVMRLPHEVKGCADGVLAKLRGRDEINTLVISPPGCGKTTMLREMSRLFSAKRNTLIIDERFELASSVDGMPSFDVGDCDVISGVSKCIAYENTIRAMSPQLIVTDELFRESEVAAVCDIVRSGVKVFASVHANSLLAIKNSAVFSPLLEIFDCFVLLGDSPIGTVENIVFKQDLQC